MDKSLIEWSTKNQYNNVRNYLAILRGRRLNWSKGQTTIWEGL